MYILNVYTITNWLKNRDGNADKSVGLAFYGECHIWRELPLPSEITDYEQFTHL